MRISAVLCGLAVFAIAVSMRVIAAESPPARPAPVSPAALLAENVPAPAARLAYGKDALEFGELRLPPGKGPFPVVMIVHGGCWADRLPGLDPRATSLDLVRPLAAALAGDGIATWNVEYRRGGNPGGGWPGTFMDLSHATDHLRTLAPKYHLDLSRFVVLGHSSGGQLALWIAARHRIAPGSAFYTRDPLTPVGVIDLDGPMDLALAQPHEREYCPLPAITQFLGATPQDQPQRYHVASATSYFPLGVPQDIVVGGLLDMYDGQVKAYAAQATSKGDRVTVTRLEHSGHFDVLSPQSRDWKVLVSRIRVILQDGAN
ncbi:MAG: hypothetical protein OJF55_002923 [Rhodanobacteraceae bacterium]|jgi:acetyl esterase/lipase|nr:MAG: hypothetical protein OJF55_002923 [Rhodanobacteraceae bacterium]